MELIIFIYNYDWGSCNFCNTYPISWCNISMLCMQLLTSMFLSYIMHTQQTYATVFSETSETIPLRKRIERTAPQTYSENMIYMFTRKFLSIKRDYPNSSHQR